MITKTPAILADIRPKENPSILSGCKVVIDDQVPLKDAVDYESDDERR